MGRVNRQKPPTPVMDGIRDWHFEVIDTVTRQHVERISVSGMLPRESLRFLLRSLRLHVKELNKRNYENRIMLEREMEALKLDRSRAANSDVQYGPGDPEAAKREAAEYYAGIEIGE